MELYTWWDCPYCGHSNHFKVTEDNRYGLSVRRCFGEDGGCERPVVIDVLSIKVALKVRRVEGEGVEEQPERVHSLAAVAEAEDNRLPTYSAEDSNPNDGIVF